MGWLEGLLVVGVLVTVVTCVPGPPAIIDSTQRDDKALFVVNAQRCGTEAQIGYCLPYFLCAQQLNGRVEGTCSLGLGECCVFERSCGESTENGLTYFIDDAPTANTVGSCDLTVTKAKKVCQLRIEMPVATLAEPDAEGLCVDQYLVVKGGQGGTSIRICGENAGQHLVVDVRDVTGPFTVSIVNTVPTATSTWRIQVEQITCDSPDLAPAGCDQYFLEATDSVKSFNYATTPSSALQPSGVAGTRHLQESYTVCVKEQVSQCGLTWTAGPDALAFTITDNPNPLPIVTVNENCALTDYLVILDGTIDSANNIPVTIICGTKFPDAVSSSKYEFGVVTNTQEGLDNDADNRGFHLVYTQKAC